MIMSSEFLPFCELKSIFFAWCFRSQWHMHNSTLCMYVDMIIYWTFSCFSWMQPFSPTPPSPFYFRTYKTSQDKTSQGQNVPKDKTSQVQNVPRDKMSQGTKRPTPISVITKFSKTHFVLENWPYMYGNGPHSCSQFMIGVLLVWGG